MMLPSGMLCIMFRHSVRMATRAFVQVIGELLVTSWFARARVGILLCSMRMYSMRMAMRVFV